MLTKNVTNYLTEPSETVIKLGELWRDLTGKDARDAMEH